jgi:uncharacterized membrane protein YhaH (DUF805 family)
MTLFQLLFGDWRRLLFEFCGRINRAKYWLTFVIYLGALFALYVLAGIVFSALGVPEFAVLFALVAFIFMAISCTAVAIKRLHDRDKSGWWLLVFYLLPSALGSIGPYTNLDSAFQLASFAISVWALVELGFLRGTAGPNRYGPDPLATRPPARAQTALERLRNPRPYG